jgi:hypothetical protein
MTTDPRGPQSLLDSRNGESRTAEDPEDLRILLRRLALLLLAIGVVWRLLRYLLCFPLWEDEAFICLNFLELDYSGLTHELRYCQVAPLLFLWGELTALRLLGPGECALRLLPFLAGIGSLWLFWRLSHRTLPPLARTLALGFLAVAIWPVSMGAFTKPYALDLFMSLLLMLLAVRWLEQPRQLRWLLLLTLTTPLALFSSYPVVFVAIAVSLSLVPTAWRQGWKARLLWCMFNVALLVSFLGQYHIAREQLQTADRGRTTERGMQDYWAEGFPPSAPGSLAKWLLLTHTGQMMAFPVGSQDGGSTLTTLLYLLGLWRFWTRRRRALLVLCVTPFALGLVAAVLHRYPYGASCRLSQHLAPAICLTAGMGAAALLERVRSASLRRRWVIIAGTLFVVIGVTGMLRDVIWPYRNLETLWTKQVMRTLVEATPSEAPIVVVNKPGEIDALFRWYLELQGERVTWAGQIDWERARRTGEMWFFTYDWSSLNAPERMPLAPAREPIKFPIGFEVRFAPEQPIWVVAGGVGDVAVPPDWRSPVKHVQRIRLVPKSPPPYPRER